MALAAALLGAVLASACLGSRPPGRSPEATSAAPDAAPPTAAPAPRAPDLDSLATALGRRADGLPVTALPALEADIRDWLARLQFDDPEGGLRLTRGRLLDALGWAAYRRRDLRQAEAALLSAADEINSRGTARGYARHFLHLGELYASRGRWEAAIQAYLDAEQRGLGTVATPKLEAVYRRRHGGLSGLDRRRTRERARIEDERRQLLVADALSRPLPGFSYPRRTGPPLASASLIGDPLVVAVWDAECAGCAGYAGRLEPLWQALRARGGNLLAVWTGHVPEAAGPPQPYPVVVPPDGAIARRTLGADSLPLLLVVDGWGWIRYRWSGAGATPPPIEDILVQVDHLRRRAR